MDDFSTLKEQKSENGSAAGRLVSTALPEHAIPAEIRPEQIDTISETSATYSDSILTSGHQDTKYQEEVRIIISPSRNPEAQVPDPVVSQLTDMAMTSQEFSEKSTVATRDAKKESNHNLHTNSGSRAVKLLVKSSDIQLAQEVILAQHPFVE